MTDRQLLQQVHGLLHTAVYEAFPEDVEDYVRDAFELVDSHLNMPKRALSDAQAAELAVDELDLVEARRLGRAWAEAILGPRRAA